MKYSRKEVLTMLLRSAFYAFSFGVIGYALAIELVDAMIDPCALGRIAGCL